MKIIYGHFSNFYIINIFTTKGRQSELHFIYYYRDSLATQSSGIKKN